MKLFEKIFSITNNKNKKVITILGHKFEYDIPKPVVVVLDPGGIGDYMLTRPYFKYFKQSPKYKGCKFVFVARKMYRDMLDCYDWKCFNKVVDYQGRKFLYDKVYQKEILDKIQANPRIKAVINLRSVTVFESEDAAARNLLSQKIKAKEKIITAIDLDNKVNEDPQFKPYTKVFTINSDEHDELENRRILMEKILEMPIPKETMSIDPMAAFERSYITISMLTKPGRAYPEEKWIQVINYLTENTPDDFTIMFLGSAGERKEIKEFIKKLDNKEKCMNIAGRIPISIVPFLLKNSKLLISIESGNVHIAHCVNAKTVCLCNGSHYRRFQPYNDENIKYVYPREFSESLKTATPEMLKKYYISPGFLTADIEVEDVIDAINSFIK